MADETLHSQKEGSVVGDQVPPEPEPTPGAEPTSRRAAGGGAYASAIRTERRRRQMRIAANVMISTALLGLVAIALFFLGTWLYTSRQQDALLDQLAADNPELARAEQAVSESDFVTIGDLAAQAIEAERRAALADLKAAADEYQAKIRGFVGRALGRIVISDIGVDTVMIEGDFQGRSEGYLRKGPGHWPETALPGQGGRVVVSGHRTTYGAPFRKLYELEPGDEIELVMPYAIVRYTVTQVMIVGPEDVEVVADQGRDQLSLVACHPMSYSSQRIIAQADLSSFVLL
jgi:LPXTG-site transpeptidase (sortase) family protein